MTRRCKLQSCAKRLPKIADCETAHQRAGFCDGECTYIHWKENQPSLEEKQRKLMEKREKDRQRAERRQMREEKQAFRENDKKHQTKETQKVFNEFIRLLDEGMPCISCGRMECGSGWDCGHFLSVGAHPELRFDPRNAFKQGRGCNRGTAKYRGADASVRKGYEQGIIDRMGQAHLDWLKGPHASAHLDCDLLIDIRLMFRAEIKYIKEHGRPSRDWRALPEEWLQERVA